MKLRLKFIFPLVAGLALSGCSFISITDSSKEEDITKITGSYYEGYNLNKTGDKLLAELQRNCWEKHTKYVAYGQFNSYCVKTKDHGNIEAISQGSEVAQLFYTGKEQVGTYQNSSGAISTSREHVWPCSKSASLWEHYKDKTTDHPHNVDLAKSGVEVYVGGGSDLYHVRLCGYYTNSDRSNDRFVSFTDEEHMAYAGGVKEVKDSGGKWSLKVNAGQQTCEPANEMKGDIARIVTYVYLHYSNRGITPSGSFSLDYASGRVYKYEDMVGSLVLTDVMGYPTEDRCKEVLKAWNKLDPPNEVEKARNNTVQKIQGNRNPFVDFPELIDQAFSY